MSLWLDVAKQKGIIIVRTQASDILCLPTEGFPAKKRFFQLGRVRFCATELVCDQRFALFSSWERS